ncbi:PilN domain-containing protein [Alicyclobacillus macrosporangiidus]|uniref:Fimbrial assembly protein (PilN) n=1 Tax=Alicyclobacillus macrosporangiidus TaxID=392015 RepID=A0A1I7JVW0_9BACL|nr:PilN domain-containing protein [Alicyclobacillus macrosporangiidus]SFU89330.1 Fimbrial assembly protein (PilN) [Alicyclobacillus macrosporangiidus]
MMDINLLPAQTVQQRYAFSIQVVVGAVLAILVVVFVVLAWSQQSRAASDETSADRVHNLVLQAQRQAASLQKQIGATGTASQVQYDTGLNVDVRDFVKSIVGRAPESAAWTSFHADATQVTLVGTIDSPSKLAAYEEALRQVDRISSVWVQSATTDQKVNFTMTMRIRTGGGTQ